jgi:hypothetical protein
VEEEECSLEECFLKECSLEKCFLGECFLGECFLGSILWRRALWRSAPQRTCKRERKKGVICSADGRSIQDLHTHCLEEFRNHWKCLDANNHQLYQCRPAEWKFNKCVFDKLVWWPLTFLRAQTTDRPPP